MADHKIHALLRRLMAHDRMPIPGYVDCLSPNVRIRERQVFLIPGPRIDDETIRACEAIARAAVEPAS